MACQLRGNGAIAPATLARAAARVGLCSRFESITLSAPVQPLDADVMITIAFSLEVVLVGLGAWIFAARELRDARVKAAGAYDGEGLFRRPPSNADGDVAASETAGLTSAWRRVV